MSRDEELVRCLDVGTVVAGGWWSITVLGKGDDEKEIPIRRLDTEIKRHLLSGICISRSIGCDSFMLGADSRQEGGVIHGSIK
jgi:hypothetical protein